MTGRAAPSAARKPRRVALGGTEVLSHGLPFAFWQDLYHLTMTVRWPLLFAGFGLCFIGFNLLFACLYWIAPDSIANINPPGYLGAFFFSVETLATVGYGDMHPQTVYGHSVAALQIFIGMLYLALLTGVVFARFSRPNARMLFAAVVVVRPLYGRRTLMLRAANARQNLIVEATARLRLVYDWTSSEGFQLRRVVDLELVREEQPLFVLGWMLMHVIDDTSPLAKETPESLAASSAVLSLTLSGTDQTTGQVLMGRVEYAADAIRWNHSFCDVLSRNADGVAVYDYRHFDDIEELPPSTDAVP
ncbi:MAG: ion channel [Pseudomonadota bacterium]